MYRHGMQKGDLLSLICKKDRYLQASMIQELAWNLTILRARPILPIFFLFIFHTLGEVHLLLARISEICEHFGYTTIFMKL